MKNKSKTNKALRPAQKENTLKGFVRKRGFYIALFSLVAILTGSVFVSSYMNKSKEIGSSFNDEAWKAAIAESERKSAEISAKAAEEVTQNIQTAEEIALNQSESTSSKNAEASAVSNEANEEISSSTDNSTHDNEIVLAENEISTDEEVQAVSAQSADNKPHFAMPCIGGVFKDFSMDELVYSKTMDDWRTHSGIDISADEGAQVKAAADGTVEKVYTDGMLGNVVIIDHGNGYKTLYANLQSADYIEPNRAVKQGDIIGGVGTSASEEKSDGAHLHFEVLKDGEPIKPEFLD